MHTFHSSDAETLATLPTEVQEAYAPFAQLNRRTSISAVLMAEFLGSMTKTFAEVHDDMVRHWEARIIDRMRRYRNFVASHPSGTEEGWPSWLTFAGGGVLAPPGIDAVSSIVKGVDELFAWEIKKDMLSRVPYEFIKIDGTFYSIGLSMSPDSCETLIIGAYGDICMHVETKAESFESLIPALMRLNERCKNLYVRLPDGSQVTPTPI